MKFIYATKPNIGASSPMFLIYGGVVLNYYITERKL